MVSGFRKDFAERHTECSIGSCTIDHVFFEDVCEDAISIKQKSGTSRINYGGVGVFFLGLELRIDQCTG